MAGILIGTVTILLVWAAEGYDYNPRTGQVIQNGLVLVESKPSNAQIFIDRNPENDLSPARLPLPKGSYEITLRLPGYRTWQSRVKVRGSAVSWLNYARLIAKKLDPQPMDSYARPGLMSASPDQSLFLVQPHRDRAELVIYRTNQPAFEPRKIDIPPTILAKRSGSFGKLSVESWSEDNQHLILKQVLNKTTAYLWINLALPQNSRNLNSEIAGSLGRLSFRSDNGEQLYSLRSGRIRLINVNTQNLSKSLVSGVTSFQPSGGTTFFYVSRVKSEMMLSYFDGTRSRHLFTLDDQLPAPLLDYGEYGNDRYLAVQTAKGVDIYRNPHRHEATIALTPAARLRLAGAKQLSFAPSGRSFIARAGSTLRSYDLAQDRQWRYQLADARSVRSVDWIDDYHLQGVVDGAITVWDVNGSNQYRLVSTNHQYPAVIDVNFNRLLFVAPTKSGQSTKLFSTKFEAQPKL